MVGKTCSLTEFVQLVGKSCLHFHKLDDLPLDAIAEVVASTPPDEFIARYEASRKR